MKSLLKPNFLVLLVLAFSMLFLTQSCKDKNYIVAKANVPIYQSKAEWRNTAFKLLPYGAPAETGKIYLYNDWLLVVEPYVGVHFYDNQNESNPVSVGVIPVLGCTDISVRNNVLYVNSLTDLVAIGISDIQHPQELSRIEDIFYFNNYYELSGFDASLPTASMNYDDDHVIIGWKVEETKLEENSNAYYAYDMALGSAFSMNESVGNVGVGGSMAQFCIVGNYLYTLLNNELESYELTGEGQMNQTSSEMVSRTCETLFGTQNYLYMGTTSGMLVYSLSSPSSPSYISEINHITSCDPVVVAGNRAYITLSSGSGCWGVNQLEVIDISNLQSPQSMVVYPMENPKGLGVESNLLFVCDGNSGVKVYDKTDDYQIQNNLLTILPISGAWDLIPYNKTLIVTAEDGIHQFDYQDVNNIHQLSHIQIVP